MTAMIDKKRKIMMAMTTTIVVMRETRRPPLRFISHSSSSSLSSSSPPPPPTHTHTHTHTTHMSIQWRVVVCACRRWWCGCRRQTPTDTTCDTPASSESSSFRRLVFIRGGGMAAVAAVGVPVARRSRVHYN